MGRRQFWRGPAQVLIKSLIPLYLRPTGIFKILVKEGMTYRHENMWVDINLHLDHHRTTEAAKDYDFFDALPSNLMVQTPFKNDRRYRTIGFATFENTITKERDTRMISFYMDRNAPGNEQEEEALELFGKEDYEKDLVLVGYERQMMWKNTGTIWERIKEIKPL